jgi:hypothetical protein
MVKNYYYFATHTANDSIYRWIAAGVVYKKSTQKEQNLLDLLAGNYKERDKTQNVLNYCSDFISEHHQDFKNLKNNLGDNLKYLLRDYLGYHFKWQSSMTSFGKWDDFIGEEIQEQDLIKEITDPRGSIKKLLDTADGDVKTVKPFLPFIMISLHTNTRDKQKMEFKHTGRFVFDFDKIGDEKTTISWMNKVWKGTKNVKPYMAFVSPSGNGFKLFCQVDISSVDFKNDFVSKERKNVMIKHKIWYEGARKELASSFSKIAENIDTATKDPQRLTLLPFISNKTTNFKYDPNVYSNYSEIVDAEKKLLKEELAKKIKKNKVEVTKVMKHNGIKSEEDAYHLYEKNKSNDFDTDFELDKLKKVVAFIIQLSQKDHRVKDWLKNTFTSYEVLNKQCWVLYGVFGHLAIDELKKLIPVDSNKRDENSGDYRWSDKSDDTYDDEERKKLTPAPFYKLVFEIGTVKDYVLDNFTATSSHISDFKLLNNYYENYKYNLDLNAGDQKNADLSEFLKELDLHLNKKKMRLPLIKDLVELPAEVELGIKDYLDKDKMHDLFQNKYAEKKIFALRSQCGTSCAVLRWEP